MGPPPIKQLQFNNGAYVSSITDFMEDNPGVVEVMVDWIKDNYSSEIEEDDTITCSVCQHSCSRQDAHLHQGDYIGDERLRTTE